MLRIFGMNQGRGASVLVCWQNWSEIADILNRSNIVVVLEFVWKLNTDTNGICEHSAQNTHTSAAKLANV